MDAAQRAVVKVRIAQTKLTAAHQTPAMEVPYAHQPDTETDRCDAECFTEKDRWESKETDDAADSNLPHLLPGERTDDVVVEQVTVDTLLPYAGLETIFSPATDYSSLLGLNSQDEKAENQENVQIMSKDAIQTKGKEKIASNPVNRELPSSYWAGIAARFGSVPVDAKPDDRGRAANDRADDGGESEGAVDGRTKLPISEPQKIAASSPIDQDEPINQKQTSVTGRKDYKLHIAQPFTEKSKSDSSRDEVSQNHQPSVTWRKDKSDLTKKTKKRQVAPSKKDMERLKRLLPDLADGGRWTVENEGYAWKIRRVWDRDGTTKSHRYFRLRWRSWTVIKERYDDARIRQLLREKVETKRSSLANTEARSA